MEEDQIQPIEESEKPGGDAKKHDGALPVTSVDVGKIAPPRNTSNSHTDTNKRNRKPLSCFEIWTIILAGLGILVAAGTGLAIVWQARIAAWTLEEIRKGGTDTHDLAVAANTQAKKMADMSTASDKIRQAAENMVTQDQRIADNAQRAMVASTGQSKAALDATIEASNLDKRAWMTLSGAGDQIEIGKPIVMGFDLRNIGKTPAKRIQSVFRMEILNASDEPTFDYSDKELTTWTIDSVMTPNETTPRIGVTRLIRSPGTDNPQPTILTQDLLDKYRNGQIWFATEGKISYEDIFGKAHWLNVCIIKANAIAQALASSPVGAKACGQYNDTSD